MTSTKPYLLRAFYEWIIDNNCTPYIIVDANYPDTIVPLKYVDNGQIVLNISMTATDGLQLGNDMVYFHARFERVEHEVVIPISAIIAIYASENGKGMFFAEEEGDDESFSVPDSMQDLNDKTDKGSGKKGKGSKGSKGKKWSHLKVVK